MKWKYTLLSVTEEAAITASSEQRILGETTGAAAILTTTQSNERQNVVIDFTKIEPFYGPAQFRRFPRTAPAAAIGLMPYSPPLTRYYYAPKNPLVP